MALLASLWAGIAAYATPLAEGQVSAASSPNPVSVPVLPPLRALNSYQGINVKAIEFRGIKEDPRFLNHLRDLVMQPTGKPLDRQKIRQSLQALYATGRFADLHVEAQRDSPQELTLVFVAVPNYFIGSITSEGAPKRPADNQLVDSTKLQLGEVVTLAKLDQAIERMQSVLRENGFYQAKITVTENHRPDVQLTDLQFHVVPGEPAHIGQVTVEGDAGYTPADIAKLAKMEPGHTVTQERATRALQKLRKKFTKQNRLESQISITDRQYHADTNLLDYHFKIQRGPTVEINLEGASLSRGKLKRFVPVYEENAVDEDLLNEGRRNIRDYLQTQGYFDAKVNYNQDYIANKDHLNIVYDVDRGDKHDVVKVEIEGNKYFEDSLIRERLQVQPQSLILSHGRFSQAQMNEDVQSVLSLYRSNGFLQATVESQLKDDYQGKQGAMAVVYRVSEGTQTKVLHLTINGNSAFSTDEILGLLNTQAGQAYSESNIVLDRDAVLNFYFDKGFPNTQFEYKSVPTPGASNSMDVTYTISEGEQFFVDRVLMSQLEFTRPKVVQNQLKIKPGDPLSQSQLTKTQSALYDLGVFNEVKMAVQNPDGDAKYKDVLIQFQEAKRWTFNYGLGMEASTGQPSESTCQQLAEQGESSLACSQGRTGLSPRVSFDVSRINLRGLAHTLTFKSNIGRLQKRALISDETKRWMDHPNWTLRFTAFYDNSINVTTFTSERLEGSVQLEDVHSRVSRFLYQLNYRRVKASNVVVTADQIPLFSQPVRVGMPSFTYIRDKRDDPIDTHNGNFTTFDTGVAAKVIGSQASFGRFLVQNSTYHPFHRKLGKSNTSWVFARNARIGAEEPFANTVIPLPERFFAGGSSSMRGFALNQAGPRDLITGTPLGGNAVFVNSFELRTPPLVLPFVEDNLSFVFFHDAGNVFQDGQEMVQSLFRWHQPRREDCRASATASQCSFAYMSQAVGTGVRYRTPIGPLRIDFGYNLNPTTYPAIEADANGQPVFASHTTRRINIFFSIGQTF